MKKTPSPEQIIDKLRQAEVAIAGGATVPEACKQMQVREQTYYRWRQTYAGMGKPGAKRLRELEENARLRKLLAEKERDHSILKEPSREPTDGCEAAGGRDPHPEHSASW